MTVQVEEKFDLYRFFFFQRKEACIMPEQTVRHQEDTDSDQQTYDYKELQGEAYENNRYDRTGRIQCRN